jgi:glucose-6-phosphate 1-dehydrogenase
MDSCLFVLLGATGDLARRKLIPALYHGLVGRRGSGDGQLSDMNQVVVLGVGRSEWDDEKMREEVHAALREDGVDDEGLRKWCDDCVTYQCIGEDSDMSLVFDRAAQLEEERGLSGNRIYYLAIPPGAFAQTIEDIGRQDGEQQRDGWTRLVIEKPFGHDLASAKELNALVHRYFSEKQVYRIDHYLGKETVQNLLVFRFANAIFESLWDRNHIDRVEITVAESIGVEGRAGYYDTSGALRDMIQNHLTQLLTLVAMEPPATLGADPIRREKLKVLHSIAPIDPTEVIFGQYVGDDGQEGYLEHDGVPADSTTETFVALRLRIENWRWQGVPFVLRTGKRLPQRVTDIDVYFRCPPIQLFGGPGHCSITRNVLRIRLQPDEGFTLGFEVKKPGAGFDLSSQHFDFEYEEAFGPLPTAYETLLADVVAGDQTLFVHAEETETAWALFEPLLDADIPVKDYPSGSWGPGRAARMLVGDQRAPTPEEEFAS